MAKSANWNFCALILVVFSSFRNVSGALLPPYLEPIPGNEPQVKVVTNGNAVELTIEEEYIINPDFFLGKITYDGDIDAIRLDEVNPTLPVKLTVIETDAYVELTQKLDFESPPTNLIFSLRQGSSINYVSVIITDINDNKPNLKINCPNPQSILEDAVVGTPVCAFEATDVDTEADKDELRYSIEDNLSEGTKDLYTLDPISGEMTLNGNLSYFKDPMHRFHIYVHDSGEIHNDTLIFTINIEDVPNEDPVWRSFKPLVKVNESSSENPGEGSNIGDLITTITATDGDIQVNSPIIYSITFPEHPGAEQYFDLNPTNGELKVKSLIIDTEILAIANDLIIIANITAKEVNDHDKWNPVKYPDRSISEIMTITMEDLNTHSPEFCSVDSVNDCSATEELVIVTNEETMEGLPIDKALFIRDLDPTQQHSTFEVKLVAFDPEHQYVVDALDINPKSGTGITSFTISAAAGKPLDYEDGEGFDNVNEGKWWRKSAGGNPEPKDVKFKVVATDRGGKDATAVVTLTVKDINDNTPIHSIDDVEIEEYNFFVCENAPSGYFLKKIDPGEDDEVCPDPGPPEPPFDEVGAESIRAKDADVSVEFGQESIVFEWLSSKPPPLTLNRTTGTMMVNKPLAFDYERLQDEVYSVVAIDEHNTGSTKRRANAVVNIKILDVNDTPVDLRLSTSRITIKENTTGEVVDVEILAEDKDVTGCIKFTMEIEPVSDELDDLIKSWFVLKLNDDDSRECYQERSAHIELGGVVDREGGGIQDVDRVDVVITAKDTKTFSGNATRSVRFTIEIEDINDNAPEFEDFSESDEIRFTETIKFDDEGDTASEFEREITSFRATDKDRNTIFTFNLSSPRPEMEESVELINRANGRAVLRGKLGHMIDRELQIDGKDMDEMYFTISVSDNNEEHTASIDITVTIDDINDNVPQIVTDETVYYVTELEAGNVGKFEATDADKADRYGNVSFLFHPSTDTGGRDQFEMDLRSGQLTVKDNTHWHLQQSYTLTIEFRDFYRPETESLSNKNETIITVNVEDVNDHAPEFVTLQDPVLSEIFETDFDSDEGDDGGIFDEKIKIRDLDDPSKGNGDFKIRIFNASCTNENVEDPQSFFGVSLSNTPASEKEATIIATKSFKSNWGVYTVCFEAEDLPNDSAENSQKTEGCYKINVKNENLNPPVFLYPTDNSTKIFISLNHPINFDLVNYQGASVPYISATDADDATTGNGKVTITLEGSNESVLEYFIIYRISEVNGVVNYAIQLRKPLETTLIDYQLNIIASDSPEYPPIKSVSTVIMIEAVDGNNVPPKFNESDTTLLWEIKENIIESKNIPNAFDPDLLVGDEIYYHIAGGAEERFKIVKNPETVESTHRLEPNIELDREEVDHHRLVIYASNSDVLGSGEKREPEEVIPEDRRYLIVDITVLDEIDEKPEFGEGILASGISVLRARTNDQILEIKTTDRDLDDPTRYSIDESSIEALADDGTLADLEPPIFELNKEGQIGNESTASLILRFQPRPNMKGYFRFNVIANDTGGLSNSKECKIYIVTQKHVVVINFSGVSLEEIEAKQSKLAEILTEAFGYPCNIDYIYPSEGSPPTITVETHFIDLGEDLPLDAIRVENMQYDTEIWSRLVTLLAGEDIVYFTIGEGQESNPSSDNLLTYFLVAGIAVIGAILGIVAVTCFFNNRSLTRRVRALTATTFGSQQSGLNRAGATTLELPNTNQHAIEGSNPIWTTKNEKPKYPDFDTESIGSGGSVLIGAEDEDYFKNHGTSLGNKNPLFNMNNEDNGSMSFGSDDGYTTNDISPYGHDRPPSYDVDAPNEFLDVPMPNVSRRNPLMNMDMHMDDSDS